MMYQVEEIREYSSAVFFVFWQTNMSVCFFFHHSSAASKFPELFSDCSLDQLSTFLENANPSCLLDRPRSDTIYGGPVCGNAFLDTGEECDCGTVEVSFLFHFLSFYPQNVQQAQLICSIL